MKFITKPIFLKSLSISVGHNYATVRGACGKGYRMNFDQWKAFKKEVDKKIRTYKNQAPKDGATI